MGSDLARALRSRGISRLATSLAVTFVFALTAQAGEIESLLQRGLPTSLDPAAGIAQQRAARPLQPMTRLPFYGLPYDLVDTSTGRLAFRVDDLVLPGRIPIVMSRYFDSGMAATLPTLSTPIYGSQFGPNWGMSYSDYIQPVTGGLVLVSMETGPISYVLETTGGSTYVKSPAFPSNHGNLELGFSGTTIDETRADGRIWRFTWNGDAGVYRLTRISDAHGNYLDVTWSDGYVTHVENSSGSWIDVTVGGVSGIDDPWIVLRVRRLDDSTGRNVRFGYDGGRLTSWRDCVSKTWTVEPDEDGRPTLITDPENRSILTVEYSQGQVRSYSSGGGVSTFTNDPGDTKVVDPGEHTWTYFFDNNGITTEVHDPNGGISQIVLDQLNNIQSFTDPNNHTWQFAYKTTSEPLTVTAPETLVGQAVWSYDYDNEGRLSKVVNPLGIITRSVRDTTGNILSELEDHDGDGTPDGDEPLWQATYSSLGDLASVTNPREKTYSFEYDSYGQVATVTLPGTGSLVVHLEFDARGNLTAIQRPYTSTESVIWTYAYNERGQILSATDPTGFARTFAYDDAGLLTSLSDPMHGTKTFTYTDSYQLASIHDTLGGTTSFSYDEAGNLLSRTDALGHATTFTYDALNRLATRTDALGRQWSYEYDAAGNVTSTIYPNNRSVSMTYDAISRLATRTYPDGTEEAYSYDLDGNVTHVERSNEDGVIDATTFAYNERDLPASVSTMFPPSSGTQVTMGASFQYDLNGNRTATISPQSTSATTQYTYDDLDRLSSVSYGDGPTRTLTYDPWSLRRKSFPTRDYQNAVTYDHYDPAGRLTQFTIAQGGAPDDGIYHLTYDSAGRLSGVQKNTENSSTNQYDALGRLVLQVLADGTQRGFAYDAVDRLVLAESTSAEGVPTRHHEFVYDEAGELVATDAGWARLDYTYDYNPGALWTMLRITRTRSYSEPSKKWIDIGYDGRVSGLYSVNDHEVGTTIASYVWQPFATGQLEGFTTPGLNGATVMHNVLDALGGPAVSMVGNSQSSIIPYEQAPVVDQFRMSTFSTPEPMRGLTDREHFRMFARRSGLDPSTPGAAVALGLSGTRASSFSGLAELLAQAGLRDELPPHLVDLGEVATLPSALYFDEDTDARVTPPGLGVSTSLGAPMGMYGEADIASDQDRNADLLGFRTANAAIGSGQVSSLNFSGVPIIQGCPIGMGYACLNSPHGVNADIPGTGDEGGVEGIPGVPFHRGLRGMCTPLSYRCGIGPGCGGLVYDQIRTSQDQEPYRNSSGDSNGVELSNGEYVLSITDLDIPWPGIPFRLTRTYRSQVNLITELGANWTHNYMERLRAATFTCGDVEWVRADMWSGTFHWNGNQFNAPPGSHLVLLRDETSLTYTLRLPSGELHYFDQFGYLSRIEDRFGNALDFFYGTISDGLTAQRRLTSVRGGLGREVVFTYDGAARLSRVTDCGANDATPNGVCDVSSSRYIEYTHGQNGQTGDELSGVVSPRVGSTLDGDVVNSFPNGKKTTYTYSHFGVTTGFDPRNHNLLTITGGFENRSGGGQQAAQTIIYETNSDSPDFDRVKFVVYPSTQTPGGTASVAYTYSGAVTTVTDRLAHTTDYEFDSQRFLHIRTVHLDASNTIKDTYTYDTDGNILTSKTGEMRDPRLGVNTFHLETYIYDTMGNMLERRVKADAIRPRGPDLPVGGNDLVTRYTYDPIYNLPRTMTGSLAFPTGSVTLNSMHSEEPDFAQPEIRKYTVRRFFDYQEGDRTLLDQYATKWGLTERLNASSISNELGQPDMNNDAAQQRTGGIIKVQRELWSQAGAAPNPNSPPVVTTYRLNNRGQVKEARTTMLDGTTRKTTYMYGDEAVPALGKEEQGLLREKTVDVEIGKAIKTRYAHDKWGNTVSETNGISLVNSVEGGRQIETRYFLNSLNQIYRVRRANAVGPGLNLTAFQYDEDSSYDEDNNVKQKRVAIDTPATAYVTASATYDFMDRVLTESMEVDGTTTRTTSYRYDEEGRRVRTMLPVGSNIKYGYDALGRQTEVRRYLLNHGTGTLPADNDTDPNQVVTKTTYDGEGNLLTITDPNGFVTENYYDGYGRRIRTVRQFDVPPHEFVVDGENDLHSQVEEHVFYDGAGQVVATEQWGPADGTSTEAQRLSRTETDYDELGRAITTCSLLNPSGAVLGGNQTRSSADPCDLVWYTRAGEVEKTRTAKNPSGTETHMAYDLAGRLHSVQDPATNLVTYDYDESGNVAEIFSNEKGSNGSEQHYRTRNAYDALNRLISSRIDPEGLDLETLYSYDSRGNLTSTTDPGTHRTEKDYNNANQLKESRLCQVGAAAPCTNAFEERIQYIYDKNGLLFEQTDGNGNTTEFWSDQLDRTVYIKYPDGTGTRSAYDKAGRLIQFRRQAWIGPSEAYSPGTHIQANADPGYGCGGAQPCLIESLAYDKLGRALAKTYSSWQAPTGYAGTSLQQFRYDGLSRLVLAFDNNGTGSDGDVTTDDVTIRRSYDSLSRRLTETQQIGYDPVRTVTSPSYDKSGNRLSLQYPSGLSVSFSADAMNRLDSVTAGTTVATYHYAGPGLLESRAYGNGTGIDLNDGGWGYDTAKRIKHVRHATQAGAAILDLEYGYDRDSLRLFERRKHEGAANGYFLGQKYTYTFSGTRNAHRLEDFKEGRLGNNSDPEQVDIVSGLSREQTQTYDPEGNWSHLAIDTDGNGVDPDKNWSNTLQTSGLGSGMNQYSTLRQSPWAYTFTGAVTGDRDSNGDGTADSVYLYDRLDRLIQQTAVDGTVTKYVYDGENRRVEKRRLVNGAQVSDIQFVYDGWRVLDEIVDTEWSQRYIWAKGTDKPLAVERKNANDTWSRYFVHGDALGSVRAVTDAGGAKIQEFRFGAFGERLLPSADPDPTCSVASCLMPYRYTGQRFDPESDLYFYKNRYYNPLAGRFLTRDPAGYVDGLNLYRYVRNGPTFATDSLGLFKYDNTPPDTNPFSGAPRDDGIPMYLSGLGPDPRWEWGHDGPKDDLHPDGWHHEGWGCPLCDGGPTEPPKTDDDDQSSDDGTESTGSATSQAGAFDHLDASGVPVDSTGSPIAYSSTTVHATSFLSALAGLISGGLRSINDQTKAPFNAAGDALVSLHEKLDPITPSWVKTANDYLNMTGGAGICGTVGVPGSFGSFSALKRSLGAAGEGRQWHHIVEQSQIERFEAKAIHSAGNVVSLPIDAHQEISAFYSSKQPFTNGLTVREWLAPQSFEEQAAFGREVIDMLKEP